jgi:hypothetical protein
MSPFRSKLQWRNRLAHGTYRQYLRHAGVVSSSLTWSRILLHSLHVRQSTEFQSSLYLKCWPMRGAESIS